MNGIFLLMATTLLIREGGGGGRVRGVVLYDLKGTNVSLSFRLEFPYSNNVKEYEALVIGSVLVLQMGIQNTSFLLSPSMKRIGKHL